MFNKVLAATDMLKRCNPAVKTAINENWKYIVFDNGRDELYNLDLDPYEENNLVSGQREKTEEVRKILNSWSTGYIQ